MVLLLRGGRRKRERGRGMAGKRRSQAPKYFGVELALVAPSHLSPRPIDECCGCCLLVVNGNVAGIRCVAMETQQDEPRPSAAESVHDDSELATASKSPVAAAGVLVGADDVGW